MGAYNDDVLFIHIPKTGGTSFKDYMAANLPGMKIPDPRDDDWNQTSKLPIGHVPLRDIEAFTGRPLDSWDRIIGIIRNPYRQQVSQWWFWHKRYAEGDQHPNSVHAAMHPRIHTWLLEPECDFHIWYEQRFHADSPLVKKPPSAVTGYEGWGGYYKYWLTVDEEFPPNLHILKMEELDTTGPAALAPYIEGTPPPMIRTNVGERIDWKMVLASNGKAAANVTMEIIESKFRWCFETGQYPVLRVDIE